MDIGSDFFHFVQKEGRLGLPELPKWSGVYEVGLPEQGRTVPKPFSTNRRGKP